VERGIGNMNNVVTSRALIVALAVSLIAVTRLPAQVSVEGNTIKERQAQPGEAYSGTFVVVNASAEPQEAKLYQTDYFASADGSNLYGAPGSSPRSNAQWVAITSSTLVIPPRSSREVSFTVAVPAGRVLSGTYWSMVMVEGVPRGSAESTLPSVAGQNVQATVLARIRYAVQVVTHVGAEIRPDAKFEAPGLRVTQEGTKVLQLDVRNTGLRSFFPVFTLELYAQDGTRVKSASASREITYPGTSLRQQFDLGALPAGTYRALVTMDAGGNAVFGGQYTLKL
jgi:hypothetical protein